MSAAANRGCPAPQQMGAWRVGIGIIAAQTELTRWYARLGSVEIEPRRFAHLSFAVCLMECCPGSARTLEKRAVISLDMAVTQGYISALAMR